jgi:phosphatidate cytidylyltransferase
VVVFAPAAFFSAFIGLLAAWGLYEVGAMTNADFPQWLLVAICGGIPALASLVMASGSRIAAALVIVAMVGLTAKVGKYGPESVVPGTLFILLGALWVGVLFPYFALLRNGRNGVSLVILMLLLVVASDSGAYFVGRSMGRIKLLPTVSPNKTLEGAFGGLASCIISGLILRPLFAPEVSMPSMALLAFGVGVLAQLGDLANSAYKRVAGVKDSGWIFPGHGGLLDRTCSLVFAVVLTYYYFC